MSSSKINEAVKEAVIAEVKKLTGYSHESTFARRYNDGDFSVKYQAERYIDIYNGKGISISFKPDLPAYDLIWQKAAEMLKICWEVQKTEDDPKRKKVLEVIKAKAQECLGWDSFDVHVTEDAGFDEFWATIEKFYGKEVPSPEGSHLIDLRVNQGLSRADYLEIIVDEVLKHLNKPHQDYTYPETVFPDNSVGYYFNQLKEPLRTKALSQAKNLSEPAESLAWALNTYQILPWGRTVEGSSFWSNVHDYFKAAILHPNSEGSKLAAQCAPDNYAFPNPPKKEAPEYIPPSPPVNPIEHALAEIDKLKGRLDELESTMEGVKEAFDNADETPEFVDRLKNYTSNPATFNNFWKKKFEAKEEITPEHTPTREQCEALWLLVKEGDKSFPNALPFKAHNPSFLKYDVLQVEVKDSFEFQISPRVFLPFQNSKGHYPTFDQCRQAIAGTLAVTLETLFNDEVK